MQIEKRGTVIGDRSAGAVMRAIGNSYQLGAGVIVPTPRASRTADLIMTDGKSLEKNGVTPDELLLPTAADLAAKRDPVLARAAELVGVHLDPENAGHCFPSSGGSRSRNDQQTTAASFGLCFEVGFDVSP
jgi:C-terminal processing protease CtpA/Prc